MNEITDLLNILGGIALLGFGIWATCALAGLYLFHRAIKAGRRPARGRRRAQP
jgi:hypothetical protein